MLRGIGRKYIEMQEARKERAENGEAGFTLIELLVVVIIIGILAAIAIPTFLSQRERAQDADAVSGARNIATAIKSESASPANAGTYSFADGWTQEEAEAVDGSLGSYFATPFSAVVDASDDTFTVTLTSESGNSAEFDNATGEVVVTEPTD